MSVYIGNYNYFAFRYGPAGSKLRFRAKKQHNINQQRNRRFKISIPVRHVVDLPPPIVSLPLSLSLHEHISDADTLCTRITSILLPSTWIVNSTRMPITLCKLQTRYNQLPLKVDVLVTLSVNSELKWDMALIHYNLNPMNCFLFGKFPSTVSNVSCIIDMMSIIDSCTVCVGNPDNNILKMWI